MGADARQSGPILRLFEVRTKPGCADELMRKFASTSADVVRNEPGNRGYFFGRGIAQDDGLVVFSSIWRDMDDIRQRFGAEWQVSFLPPGYDDLIEACSVRYFDLAEGWHVTL